MSLVCVSIFFLYCTSQHVSEHSFLVSCSVEYPTKEWECSFIVHVLSTIYHMYTRIIQEHYTLPPGENRHSWRRCVCVCSFRFCFFVLLIGVSRMASLVVWWNRQKEGAKRKRTNGILKSRRFEVVSIPRRNWKAMNPRRIHCWYQFHRWDWLTRVSS